MGLPVRCDLVAYADELALVAEDQRVDALQKKVEEVIGKNDGRKGAG